MDIEYDPLIQQLAEYTCAPLRLSEISINAARLCLADASACALLALNNSACVKRLGVYSGNSSFVQLNGPELMAINLRPDLERAAFDLGCCIRWLDFNDTWLAAEWGHPSDNLGAILAAAGSVEDKSIQSDAPSMGMVDLLEFIVKAYEIQGVLALENSFNKLGFDHVILVKIASTAVVTRLLGGGFHQVCSAISHAWADGCTLRVYRQGENTGPRKSWAVGDSCARAITLARLALAGESGIKTVLSTPRWGFEDVCMHGKRIELPRKLSTYVIDNILFKLDFPAEFHAQTACEAAIALHPDVRAKLGQIDHIDIETHRAALTIIDKSGDLQNSADRDHCLQYMVAVCLIFGQLRSEHYQGEFHANNPQIDMVRSKIRLQFNDQYELDYHDANKRAIANSVRVLFKDGTSTEKVEMLYPLGHPRRRVDALPVARQKFCRAVSTQYSTGQTTILEKLLFEGGQLMTMTAAEYFQQWQQDKDQL